MPRKARVATMCLNGKTGPTIEENMERAMALLDLALKQAPDVVCLPENFATAGTPLSLEEKAEAVPGRTTDACAKRAREHRAYVLCPMQTKRDGRIYNSVVIIDRTGEIAGIYDKVHPVTTTSDVTVMEGGVTPGVEAQVFEFDFGRVGFQICFDIGFHETWRQLAERGAELVFWPSAYDGGFPLKAYAYLHGYYVVSSVRTSHARIIDPLGEVLERTGRHFHIASRVIDFDYIVCHYDFHGGLPEKMIDAYGTGVSVEASDEEGRFLVTSNRDDVPLSRLVEEFGLEDETTYHRRHLPAYDALRAGRTPEPQETPYINRAKWG